jgi:hypothetical protein
MYALREATVTTCRPQSLALGASLEPSACRVSPGASLTLSSADGLVSYTLIIQAVYASCGSAPALRPLVPSNNWNPDFPERSVLDGRDISAFAFTPASDIWVGEFTCGLNLSCWLPHSPPCLACFFLSPYWAPLQTASRGHYSSTATSRPGKRIDIRRAYLPVVPRKTLTSR